MFFFALFRSVKNTRGIMSNETVVSNSTNCSAWQQTSSTDSNNKSADTPSDSTVLPVRYHFFNLFRM